MRTAFVLLSGGLDSTTCLYKAKREYTHVEGVSINYGQRHSKELTYARNSCAKLSVQHTVIDLHSILGGAMLTDKGIPIPDVRYEDIKGVSPTYVPFRNGLLLSLVTAYAQKWINADDGTDPIKREGVVVFGAHAEDAHNWAYPDCTPEFIGAMANAIYIGTYRTVRLSTPLMTLTKAEIVTLGHRIGVPFEDTWSCYAGGDMHCGACPTCYARQDAFSTAGVPDPTVYATEPQLQLNRTA